MMSAAYIDSESDEEEENEQSLPKGAHVQIQDIQKLKEQTGELLDPTWKESRNRHLLGKMLELDEPAITAKMVDFLLQDTVCDVLLSFVTQLGTERPRPGPEDSQLESLKTSYKAVVLLSADEPSEPLIAFLSKRSMTISRALFDIFRDDSAGSFYHAYRILECLLRCFPADVYEGLSGDGRAAERIRNLLRYIGYAPVGELLVMIIALTPISRMSQMYSSSLKNRWQFFEQMSQWIFMLKLTEVVVNPEDVCCCDSYVDAEMHSAAAAQVLQELVEKLSLEDTGELLLQPLGCTTSLLDHLVDAAIDTSAAEARRRSAIKLLCFLLRRAAEPEIMCMLAPSPGGQPMPSVVPNRLFQLRERIICHIETRMPDVFRVLIAYGAPADGVDGQPAVAATVYSGYTVEQPFSSMRLLLVELLVLMVESDEAVSIDMPVDLWRQLITWTLKYAHNNIYHAFFYRILFAVLRQNQEQAQRTLLQKAKFVTFLIDSFLPFPATEGDVLPKRAPAELINRAVARGLLLNCANALRLQAECIQPSSYLCMFLRSHQRWNDWQPQLELATDLQQRFGMGIRVTDLRSNTSLLLMSENKSEDDGTNHGSRFAKNLGFYDDVAWTGGLDPQSGLPVDLESYDEDDEEDEGGDDSDSSDDDGGEVGGDEGTEGAGGAGGGKSGEAAGDAPASSLGSADKGPPELGEVLARQFT